MSQAGALRCTFCGINYPVHPQFEVCPIHEEPTTYHQNAEPDEDWKPRAEKLYLAKIEEDTRPPIPKTKGEVPILEEDGMLFVKQGDLIRAGVKLQRLNGSFHLFEHDGFIYETQGWQESQRRWWVEKVSEAILLPRKTKEEKTDKVPVA